MKSIVLFVVLSLSSISAFAFQSPVKAIGLQCVTAPNSMHSSTTITLTDITEYTAKLSGVDQGGIAQFIRNIGPYNVKIEAEGDMVNYQNREEGVELSVVTTAFNGTLESSANFKEGTNFHGLAMTCKPIF